MPCSDRELAGDQTLALNFFKSVCERRWRQETSTLLHSASLARYGHGADRPLDSSDTEVSKP